MKQRLFRLALAGLASTAFLVIAGCNGNNNEDLADLTDETVNVTLQEYSVSVDDTNVGDGEIRFDVTNAGTVEHEFLVVKTDLAADSLPTNPDGSYQENGPGTVLIDEIDGVAPSSDEQLVVDLAAGHYVLLCNMVTPAGTGHYSLGMRRDFYVN